MLLLTSCFHHDPTPIQFATDPHILRGRYEGVIDTRYATAQLALTADGQTLAMGGGDGIARVQLWDTQTQTVVRSLGRLNGGDFVDDVAITADGSRVASAVGGNAQIWEVATGKVVQTLRTGGQLALTPDGSYLASATYGDARVVVREVATGREQIFTAPGDTTEQLTFSADGTLLAALFYDTASAVGRSHPFSVHIWQVPSGAEVLALESVVTDTESSFFYPLIAFSADGHSLAYTENNQIRVHDIEKDRRTATLPLPDAPSGIALSPDGLQLAAGGLWTPRAYSVKIFSVTSQMLDHELKHVNSAEWSQDGRFMLALTMNDSEVEGQSGPDGLITSKLLRTGDFAQVGTFVNGKLHQVVLEATPEYVGEQSYGVTGTLQLGDDAPIPFEGTVDGGESQRYLTPQHSLPEPAEFVLNLRDHPWSLRASQDNFSEVQDTAWRGYIEDSTRPDTFNAPQLELKRVVEAP